MLLPHDSGLAGHSDGDVLLHALTDALLGAVAAGDIGSYFPPSDPQWKGADSAVFVREAMKQIAGKGYTVGNVDCTLILAAPKIGPYAKAIQQNVAKLLGVDAGAGWNQGQDAGRHRHRQRGHRAGGGAVD